MNQVSHYESPALWDPWPPWILESLWGLRNLWIPENQVLWVQWLLWGPKIP
jgi:hypothetical protein